jgi:hypothetical protein
MIYAIISFVSVQSTVDYGRFLLQMVLLMLLVVAVGAPASTGCC